MVVCLLAYEVFETTFETCESFLKSFEEVRRARQAKGASTDTEQDLLRAMLVFACSGLDALIKQLVKDALPTVIEKNEGAEAQFRRFIEKQIGRDQKFNLELVALSLTSRSPREQTVARSQEALTGESLQSKDQVFQVAAIFDIPTNRVCSAPNDLHQVFQARNKIIHEMDIERGGPNRSRVPRAKPNMVRAVNLIFEITSKFLHEVDARCT